jgi:hypothetical protein
MKATFHAVSRAGTDKEKKTKIEEILERTRRELETL